MPDSSYAVGDGRGGVVRLKLTDTGQTDAQTGEPLYTLAVSGGAGGGGGDASAANQVALNNAIGTVSSPNPGGDASDGTVVGFLKRLSSHLANTVTNLASLITLNGSVTETAPASDTASSGQNGRLQRIAQRLTSLIALLPAALGQGTMAQSLRVVLASDHSVLPVRSNAAITARNGTITAGGTAQTFAAANANRRSLWFKNESDTDMWLNDSGTASAALPSVRVGPGGFYDFAGMPGVGAVSLFCASTGKAFNGREI